MFWNLAIIGIIFLVGFLANHIVKYMGLRFDNMILNEQVNEIRKSFEIYRNVAEIQSADLNRRMQAEIERNADLQKNIIDMKKAAYSKNISVSEDTIAAVKYAIKKSHPDSGGNAEDFIKFQKVYEELTRKRG